MDFKRLNISDFIEPELQVLRKYCNFTEPELTYFNLRAKGKSNVQISMEMNVSESTVSSLAKKVKQKILRVL